jgi:predicted Zn-dependent protease
VDAHLKVAEEEDGVLQIVHYAQGLLALRRNQPEEAVRLLRQSASEEPADRTYYQLAKALRLTGQTAEADRIMATFTTRVNRNKDAINLMKRISEKPEDRQRYSDAVQFFTRHGMTAQAAAVDAEMRHRFHQRNL